MSTDPDRKTACPDDLQPSAHGETHTDKNILLDHDIGKKKPNKGHRKVCFPPEDDQLVTEYFEPANPWQDVPSASRDQLVAEYLESCRRHRASPIPSVLEQIQELPDNCIGGATRAPRLTLSECDLKGPAPGDALEAVLRKTQFRRVEVDNAVLDDEGAEALFDMIEYYESAIALCIGGPRDFGVRGWQAACRMIKKSAELSELEVHSAPLEASHATVLARALRPHSCRLRALALQRASLAGEPLLCLVIALKSNSSIRELRLGDNGLGPSDAAQLAALLRANALLQLLDLSNNQIQDAGAAHIAGALVDQAAQTPPSAATSPLSPHHCPVGGYDSKGLAFLVLWNNQLTRNCATHLGRALRSSSSLCVLNVGRNALGCDSLKSLHGPALASLGLQAARLGGDAGRHLADLIRHSARLQRLDLRDNKLGSAGLQAILQAMKDNNTVIQIDLDDTTESTTTLTADANTAATCARLTREIRALCLRNEPHSTAHRVHRKISLTCRSACLQPGVPEEERKPGRLRSPAPSPAPSPAGSPIPGAQPHSRFSVTRVTPDRESSTSSNESSPSTSSPAPSRFRVMQVSEPPQIQVQLAESRRSASRFSVTRNYDTMYNPVPKPVADTLYTDLGRPDAVAAKDSALIAKLNKSDVPTAKCEVPTTKSGEVSRLDSCAAKDSASLTELTQSDVPTTKSCTELGKLDSFDAKSEVQQEKPEVQTAKSSTELVAKMAKSECEVLNAKDICTSEVSMQLRPEVHAAKDGQVTKSDVQKDCEVPMAKDSVPMVKEENKNADDVQLTKPSVEIKSDMPIAKQSVLTAQIASAKALLDAQPAKSDVQDAKTPNKDVQTNQNEERNVHSNKVDIRTAPNLNTAKDVVTTAVLVHEPSEVHMAKEVKSTEDMLESSPEQIHKASANTRVVQNEEHSDLYIAEDKFGEIVQNVEVSEANKDAVGLGNSEVPQNAPGEATESKSVKSDVISDVPVKMCCDVGDAETVKCDTDKCKSDISDNTVKLDSESDMNYVGSSKTSTYKDKTEQIYHGESKRLVGGQEVNVKESKLVTNTTEVTDTDKMDVKVEVSVKLETLDAHQDSIDSCKPSLSRTVDSEPAKVHENQNLASDARNDKALKQIEAITEDLNILIKDMQSLSTKTSITRKTSDQTCVKSDYTQTESVQVTEVDTVTNIGRESVILKKNKSESSLDSPDLEVSRLMQKKPVTYCDSSSSYSGSSMESLTADKTKPTAVERALDVSLDRRKHDALSTESSLESSDATPINSANLLNSSVSSQDSVSPVFGTLKKTHGSFSSLEASVSSLDSARGQERVMVTSADSGIEYSLQHPSDSKEDSSSNEGTLTNNSSLKETQHSERGDFLKSVQDTLTSSPKRTSSLLDVPALKSKGIDRVRKISFVAPSASFQMQRPEEAPKESKLPTNLEKLLSLFHNPGSLFSRSNSQTDDERKSASNTPPRKEAASVSSSFWSWGNPEKAPDKDEDDEDSSPEVTDSTLSERVQVSYVDESFSKKLDSKTPSTDTDNTLSEFPSSAHCTSEGNDVTMETTDDNIVQNVDLSAHAASPNGNELAGRTDLNKPNDMNKNVYDTSAKDTGEEIANTLVLETQEDTSEVKTVEARPRSFAAVLKSSATENTDRQSSPDNGQPVDKLPSKVIRGIKENISPENTLTSSMTNTKTLALELNERQVKNQPIVNAVWEVSTDKSDPKCQELKEQTRLDFDLATAKPTEEIKELDTSIDSGVTSIDDQVKTAGLEIPTSRDVDLGKDALSYLIYENQDFEPDAEPPQVEARQDKLPVLSEELRDADLKFNIDLSPELVMDVPINLDLPEVFSPKDLHRAAPIAPERAKIKSNSLEDLSQRLQTAVSLEAPITPKGKSRNIVFNVPETSGTIPRDIPERRSKLRSRSGSSPKSLPESLNKPAPIAKLDSMCKKKKKISSLGKMARDSLLALNKTEDEIADIRREYKYKLTSVESLRSLESVSEDANSQSGNSADSRCRCLRASQESLMSLDSITEDCRCDSRCDRSEAGHSAR